MTRLNQEAEIAAIAALADGPIRVGIGIATGDCIIGNMGSQQRFDYTVLGDRVNLAAPLEAKTKGWQLPVLLCDQTARMLQDSQQPDRGLASCLVRLGPVRLARMQRDETVLALLEHPLAADQQAALARTLARTLGHREAAEGQ